MHCAFMMRVLLLLCHLGVAFASSPMKVVVEFDTNGRRGVYKDIELYEIFEEARSKNIAVELFRRCGAMIDFSFLKCNSTILHTDAGINNGSHLFQDEWLRYFIDISLFDCNDNLGFNALPIQMFAFSRRPTHCKFIFRLAPRKMVIPAAKFPETSYSFNRTLDFIAPYKISLPIAEIQKDHHIVKLTNNFTVPVQFCLGKCGLVIPSKVTGNFDKPYEMNELIRLMKLTCDYEQTSSFDVYLNTTGRNNGTFTFSVAEMPSSHALGVSIIVLVSAVLIGVLFLACVALRQCFVAAREPRNRFEPVSDSDDHWMEMSEMSTESLQTV